MQTYITIHRLFRRLQQKNRFIGRISHTGLTTAETHFLLELQADSTRSIVELAALLQLNQSSCSRIAHGLQEKAYIKSEISNEDSRRRVLSITKKGSSVINDIDTAAESIIDLFKSRISKDQFQFLVQCLELIADGYQHPRGIRRPGESHYRVQQRRITRCFGLLGDHVFESDITSSQWQALSEVVLAPTAPRTTEIAELLGLAQNSLTTVIHFLERKGYIKRKKLQSDKRVVLLIPQEKGVQYCRTIEVKAARDLERGLSSLSKQKLRDFIEILSLFVGESDPAAPALLPDYQILELQDDEQRSLGRSFALRALIELGLDHEIPETTVSKNSRTFIIAYRGEAEALFECNVTDSLFKIIFAAWRPQVSPWILFAALNQIDFRIFKSARLAPRSTIEFKPLALIL